MMKRVLATALVLFAAVFTACGDGNKSSSELNDNTSTNHPDVSGFSLDSFNIETDYQPFFDDNNSIVACEEGYYKFADQFLYFIDKNTMQPIPLCAKPDCKHYSGYENYEECNAYFSPTVYMSDKGLFYYNSSLYLIGAIDESNSQSLYLYKISKDGSRRERVCHILDAGSDLNSMNFRFILHKGNGYLSYSGDNKAELFTFNIEDKEAKLSRIDEIQGYGAEIYRLKGCENGISYQYGSFTDDSLETYEGGIKISVENKTETVVKDAVKSYVITNGSVYYEVSDGLKVYSISSKKTRTFETVDNNYSVNYDGKYFYTYDVMDENPQTLSVYDSNEKYITSLEMPENIRQNFLLFGDVDNFFVNCCKQDGIWCDMYFDKSKISDENAEWIILYEYS